MYQFIKQRPWACHVQRTIKPLDLNKYRTSLKRNHTPKTVWRNPWQFIAFGCGSGASLLIPGTIGSLAAIPIYLLLSQLSIAWYSSMVVIAFILGCILCEQVSHSLGVHDHPGIVFDEWVGMWISLWLLPSTLTWIIGAFILFRIFDIIKPWPIAWVDQRINNGIGIMLDDVLAAIYANGLLHCCHYFIR